VGQFAIASARLLGAERVVAIDRLPDRLRMARERAGATDALNYEQVDVIEALEELTGRARPDACIDAVGTESHSPGVLYAYDRGQAGAQGRERSSASSAPGRSAPAATAARSRSSASTAGSSTSSRWERS
jgi:threonine dehydrogenase-like Zn-dependent dehydrogenase